MGFRIRPRRREERGAVAVLFAALVVVLFIVAALGVDIAQQVNRKHLLINQLDASSTAAAAELGAQDGSIASAIAAATSFFASNGEGTLSPKNVDFWCVVARKLNGDNTPFSPAKVADFQIPTATQTSGVCNPDPVSADTKWFLADYQNRTRPYDGSTFKMTCNNTLCAVPCALNASPANGFNPGTSIVNNLPIKCNTIRVGAEQGVPFSFAPVIGVDEGSTGSQISVACAGSCGAVAPNPMDVVVVADRTRSMLVPFLCTKGSPGCTDYRTDLEAGILGMLQVMTPEQQYVAFGALGPSDKGRSSSETKPCNNSPTSNRGLIYPSSAESSSPNTSWVPIQFKKDYLGASDANGVRSINTGSNLVKAVQCLDAFEPGTRTALASPLKAAARFLLNKTGDNNVAALGGAARSGAIKKVIIFETDGQPWENATTSAAGAMSLDNGTDIFSKYTDYTTSNYTAPAVLSNAQNGNPSAVSPAPPSPYNNNNTTQYPNSYNNSGSHSITYKYRTSNTTTTTTRTSTGGQKACQNFKQVAQLAKDAGILVITIGYNLNGSTMCSGENDVSLPNPASSTSTGTPWVSDLQPATCQSGSGTPASPYTRKSSCTSNMTITYTVPQTTTTTVHAIGSGDQSVTDALADASGGPEVPAGASNGCGDNDARAAENSDEDLFFCAAQGQDMAPLFVTALSKVTSGIKLINLP